MKHTQTIVLFFGLVAAVLGIYYAERSPFTHIAAAAVLVATVVGIVQAFQAADEAAFVQQTLSHLARSTPPSSWWKEQVDRFIQTTASSQGYLLATVVFDNSNPRKPDTNTIFLFTSRASQTDRPSGLLVVTPADYAELSLFAKNELMREVQRLIFGRWGRTSARDAADRVCGAAVALYTVPRVNEGFKVVMMPHSDSAPLRIEVGPVQLSFDPATVAELLDGPPILRDLRIAEAIETADPLLSKYLKVSH